MTKNFDAYDEVSAAANEYLDAAKQEEQVKIDRSEIIPLTEIHTTPELSELYPIDEEILNRITNNMIENGYGKEEPLAVFRYNGVLTVADGNTRFQAAKKAGIKNVPVVIKTFTEIHDAVRYARHRQVDRRNLTNTELLKYVEGSEKSEYGEGRTAQKIADDLNVSRTKIQNIQKISSSATEEEKESFLKGDVSAAALAQKLRDKEFIDKTASEEDKLKISSGEIDAEEYVQKKRDEMKAVKKAKEQEKDDKKHDALGEPGSAPHGLSISDHSDHIERTNIPPTAETSNVSDRLIQARHEAYQEGLKEGAFGGENLAYHIMAAYIKGIPFHEMYQNLPDFSYSVLSKFRAQKDELELIDRTLRS